MNIRQGLEIGTRHMTTKGEITIINHYMENDTIYTTYILNDVEYTKKHSDVYKNIYYYLRKTNGTLPQRGMSSRRTRRIVAETLNEVEYARPLKFGIELELCVRNKQELREELENAGVNVDSDSSDTHRVRQNAWKMVYDGSINSPSGYRGVELVSPPSCNFDDIKKVCDVLKKVGAKANSSCGFHVHHDIHEYKRKQIMRIYNFYNKFEKMIDKMHKSSRANNEYAKPVSRIIDRVNSSETKDQLLREVAGKGSSRYYNNIRYYKINLRSYLYYGTIEFRQAAGTIKYDEIVNWIDFTHKIIERGLEIGNDVVYPTTEESMQWENNPQSMQDALFNELHINNTRISKHLTKRIEKTMRRMAA